MAWLKLSDRWANHPLLLAVRRAPRADNRSVNEIKGFLTSCATASAGYLTDGRFDLSTAEQYGQNRTELLLRQATHAGLVTVEGRGNARVWTLVDDEDLWHIRAREDVEWERQRNRDRKNPDLTVPVRARDGDQCRYCGAVVNWKDTRGGRGGSYDHIEPGKPATVDTYVVCCKSCNSKLSDAPRPVEGMPLNPPPPLPYFSPKSNSLTMIEAYLGRSIRTANNPHGGTGTAATRDPDTAQQRDPDTASARPAPPSRDTAALSAIPAPQVMPPLQGAEHAATRDPDTAQQRDPDTASARPAPSSRDTAALSAIPADQAGTSQVPAWSRGGRPGRDGTGRDGSGPVRTGLDWSGLVDAGAPPSWAVDPPGLVDGVGSAGGDPGRSRRGRRGRRGPGDGGGSGD